MIKLTSVLAAFLSRFESAEFWVFFLVLLTMLGFDGYVTLISAVGGSFSIRSTPLPKLPFSGLVFADETFVNAVVVSLIVGSGRPITATTAAAIPPEPCKPAAVAMIPVFFWSPETLRNEIYLK